MIGVYLRPDITQVIKGDEKKDGHIRLKLAETTYSYYEAVKQKDVDRLIEMFIDIKSMTAFTEELYLVLPDTLFCKIDCCLLKQTADKELENRQLVDILARLPIQRDDLYVTVPTECKSLTDVKKTVYVIEKKYIDVISEAARLADIPLVSIEAASMAYLRGLQQWNKEIILVEAFKEEACLINFSPVAGIFRCDTNAFTEQNIGNSKELNDAIIINDTAAKDTFDVMNANCPIQFLHENMPVVSALQSIDDIKSRIVPFAIFPKNIDFEDFQGEQAEWIIPIGAILQGVSSTVIYESKPDHLVLLDSNVLPEEFRKQSRSQRVRKLTKKYTKILIAFLLGFILLEICGLLYASTVVIPQNLQLEFNQAKGEMDIVKKELDVINTANTEEQTPMTALQIILSQKPQNLGFSEIEIGSTTSKNKKDKPIWITFTAKSGDPIVIRDYTNRLAEDDRLKDIHIEQIVTSSTNDIKSATVTIGKGKVE
jgi:hypothetical protein